MIPVILTNLLVAGSIVLMAGAVAHNQINPSYTTALSVPFANIASLMLALLAMAISVTAHKRNKAATSLKRTMLFAIACTLVLAALLPLADLGHLSRVR
ncbi:hypothetical protein [Pelagibius sp. Alg239-R121]|uniref:hypothetical protein n=1 Tax=Pelagibius sp. Alg239-R121 TaxID=2993448 RepID=UPI0024A797EA|nr:hypothetical protein [Pelagibius sp. Alg239-R121]